jgi:hypothetical protein
MAPERGPFLISAKAPERELFSISAKTLATAKQVALLSFGKALATRVRGETGPKALMGFGEKQGQKL